MTTEANLAATAITMLAPLGLEAGKTFAKSAASDLWDWIRAKLPEQAAALEAAPDQSRPRNELEYALEDLLKAHPELATKLRSLVGHSSQGPLQHNQVTGKNNTTVSNAGNNNQINIKR